jgi:hypothetical protein
MVYIALFDVLSKILTKNGSLIIFPQYYSGSPINKFKGHSLNSINFQFLQADPTYITWCIEKNEDFFVYPSDLEILKKKDCRYLSHFELSKKSDNHFSYKPIFVEKKFNLFEKVIILNKEKSTDRFTTGNFGETNNDFDNLNGFCIACHESPCMCSDRESSSSIFDY